jgi:hypothetical protein
VAEKQGNSTPFSPCLLHRERFNPIEPLLVPPPSSCRWDSARRRQPISLQEAATTRDIPQHRREPGSCQVALGKHQPAVPGVLD